MRKSFTFTPTPFTPFFITLLLLLFLFSSSQIFAQGTGANYKCYNDKDGDGFGDPNDYILIDPTLIDCSWYPGRTDNGLDCDDYNAGINPNSVWYRDMDNDGYKKDDVTITQCNRPAGYKLFTELSNKYDCNDNDPSQMTETFWRSDPDGDGYITIESNNSPIYGCKPGPNYVTIEQLIANGSRISNSSQLQLVDCNEGNPVEHPNQQWYSDLDGDGYPESNVTTVQCDRPVGYKIAGELASLETDCNDNDPLQHPYQSWYADFDNDGYAPNSFTLSQCPRPLNYKTGSELYSTMVFDCNDNDAVLNPGTIYYKDFDKDGYDAGIYINTDCDVPEGYTTSTKGPDCDDNDASINPETLWYLDNDNDGYRDRFYLPGSGSCSPPQDGRHYNKYTKGSDCDDNDPNYTPETVWVIDFDGDGFYTGDPYTGCVLLGGLEYVRKTTQLPGDCNDNDASIYPKSLYRDVDEDGYDGGQELVCYVETVPTGYSLTTNGSDCNDNNASIHPGATELENGVDDDCDLYVDEGFECSSPTYVEANNITGNSATISWDQATNAIKYRLFYKSEHQKTWSSIVVNGTSFTLSGLLSNTLYFTAVKSVCPNNEISQYVAASSFTTSCTTLQSYCTTSSITWDDYYIDKVELGNIKNTSGDNQGYGNFTGLSTILKAGTTARIKLTPGYNSQDKEYDFWVVYIDYNQDGYFRVGDGERVVMGENPGITLSKPFNIPGTAKNGCTRMRVIMNYDQNKKPCGYFGMGEIEDYTVNIVGGASAAKSGVVASTSPLPASVRSITVIPNPINSGTAIAQINMIDDGNATIRISDLSGKILYERIASNLHAGKNTIDLNGVSKLMNGIYIINAEQNGMIIGRGQVIVNR